MIKLAPKPPRKRTETDVVYACLQAVNRIGGVRATRNNVGMIQDSRGIPVTYGLGVGSPDIVGVITFGGNEAPRFLEHCPPIAIAFALEVKRPTEDGGRSATRDQKAWALVAARRGMLVGLVRAPDEAVSYVYATIKELRQRLLRLRVLL